MDAQFAGKKVPWSQLEEYLLVHQRSINACLDLEKSGQSRALIEMLLPNSFWTIHQTVTKIIKDNNLSPKEEEAKVDQLQFIVKTVMKLQSSLISQNTSNQQEIRMLINSMKPEIEKTFGSQFER